MTLRNFSASLDMEFHPWEQSVYRSKIDLYIISISLGVIKRLLFSAYSDVMWATWRDEKSWWNAYDTNLDIGSGIDPEVLQEEVGQHDIFLNSYDLEKSY